MFKSSCTSTFWRKNHYIVLEITLFLSDFLNWEMLFSDDFFSFLQRDKIHFILNNKRINRIVCCALSVWHLEAWMIDNSILLSREINLYVDSKVGRKRHSHFSLLYQDCCKLEVPKSNLSIYMHGNTLFLFKGMSINASHRRQPVHIWNIINL